MEIVVLGTSSMVPTADRNHSATLLAYNDQKILIDCGEGTQRQLRKSKISAAKITKILISHWHGDHILGLPGLIQTLGASEYSKVLQVFGPKGTKKSFEQMFEFFVNKNKRIKYTVTEVEEGIIFQDKNIVIEAYYLVHSAPTIGYVIKEKDRIKVDMEKLRKFGLDSGPKIKNLQMGRNIEHQGKVIQVAEVTRCVPGQKVAFVTDTKICQNAIKIARNADLLFCEATFREDCKDKAEEYMHLTAKQAASIAKDGKAKRLVLVHFSQRYKSVKQHVDEAKEIFSNTMAAEDFQEFIL
jgi:ribonuclease Z